MQCRHRALYERTHTIYGHYKNRAQRETSARKCAT